MAISNADFEEQIAISERTLELWGRVCGEIDDGKPWEEIDCGLLPEGGRPTTLEYWTGYMRASMYHELRAIVSAYRDLQNSNRN